MKLTEEELESQCEYNKLELFQIYRKYDDDWKERIRKFEEEGGPEPTLEQKYELKLGQCDELMEQIKQQKRLLRWRNGEQIEPQAHQASAVITGTVGM